MKYLVFFFALLALPVFGQQDSIVYKKLANTSETYKGDSIYYKLTYTKAGDVMITWGNAISTVTLDGNGNTITGTAVTTAVAGTRRMFKYYDSSGEWVKIF